MFSVGQEYADDCSAGSTNPELIDKFHETVPQQLQDFWLCVNEEKGNVSQSNIMEMTLGKNTLLLGSKLDTECDISRKK